MVACSLVIFIWPMQAAVTMIFEAPPIFLAISSQVSSFSRLAVRIFSVTFGPLHCLVSTVVEAARLSAGGLTAASPGFTSFSRRGS